MNTIKIEKLFNHVAAITDLPRIENRLIAELGDRIVNRAEEVLGQYVEAGKTFPFKNNQLNYACLIDDDRSDVIGIWISPADLRVRIKIADIINEFLQQYYPDVPLTTHNQIGIDTVRHWLFVECSRLTKVEMWYRPGEELTAVVIFRDDVPDICSLVSVKESR